MLQERDLESLVLPNNIVNPEISGTLAVGSIKAETPNASRKSFLTKLTSAAAIATTVFISTPATIYAKEFCGNANVITGFPGLLFGFLVGELVGQKMFEDEGLKQASDGVGCLLGLTALAAPFGGAALGFVIFGGCL